MSNISDLFPQEPLPKDKDTFCPHSWIWCHWNMLRGTQIIPTEDRIFPVGVAMALDDAFLVQKSTIQSSQIITAGENISALFGRDLRGASACSLIDMCLRAHFRTQMQEVFNQPGVITAQNVLADTQGQDLLRMQILPVLDTKGRVRYAIGTLTKLERTQSCVVEIDFDALKAPASNVETPEAKAPYLSLVTS